MANNWNSIFSGLPGTPLFERASASWTGGGAIAATSGAAHFETTEAGPALFIGRRTRNLLPREFAPLAELPPAWRGLTGIGAIDNGAIAVRATDSPVTLSLPSQELDPESELLDEGATFSGVLYYFSCHARGTGKLTLTLRDEIHALEVSKTFDLSEEVRRPCIALDGPLEPRRISASLTVEWGTVVMHGLMLEPYVMTYRSVGRAVPYPCAGGWVPGGEARAADSLRFALPRGSLPASGMIDFWFRPTWESLHPNHQFFEMSHWYFGFGAESQEPLFHAGQRPCAWTHYWEWGRGQGFAANTWHHAAVTWTKEGLATVYWDGQPRACAQQVAAHAFDPMRVGETLAIGSKVECGMFADPNVASQLEGYLRTFRLSAGRFTAEDVLLALEESDPLPRTHDLPASIVFIREGQRMEAVSVKDYCWFPVQGLEVKGDTMALRWSNGGDTHLSSNLRQIAKSGDGGRWYVRSSDGGKTWTEPKAERARMGPQGTPLPDGRICHFPFMTQTLPDGRSSYGKTIRNESFQLRIADRSGNEEVIVTKTDMRGINGGLIPPVLNNFLVLNDGGYLLFGCARLENDARMSMIVLASDDLHHWTAVAVPMRDEGLTEEGFNEACAAQHPDGRIILIARTGGFNQYLARSFSHDNGRTWTPNRPSGVCGVAPILRVLKDGTLLLNTGRPGITVAASGDFGATFSAQVCAEDCRVHEFVNYFGWYGYSMMNNGFIVDESTTTMYQSYDLLGVRRQDDAASRNACYIRSYPYRVMHEYPSQVKSAISADHDSIKRSGEWRGVPGKLLSTSQTGAALEGEFDGTGLVVLCETAPVAGTALVQIDDEEARRVPLYYPNRLVQRRLLAADLAPGTHRFRIALEAGYDPQHKFANPEMPVLGGAQSAFLAGVTPARQIALRGFEILK